MLEEHLRYVADQRRLEKFELATRRVLKAGDTVADLGCGSGVLGLLSVRAGAGRIYAIDSTAIIEIARDTFARAGLADRAVFIRDHSRRVELPERVDAVICDHVGYFGFDYGIVEMLADARRRFLRPGGTLVPQKIRLQLAPIESEKCRATAQGWGGDTVPAEFRWVREYGINAKHAVRLAREEVLGPPVDLGEIDLRVDNPDYFSWSAEVRVARDGVLHGLAGWFECELAEGVWMTNSPLSDGAVDRPQAFLPIGEAVRVAAGDVVRARVMARPADHLIAWVVDVNGKRFSHSTWQGMPVSPEDLLRASPARVPRIKREARARSAVLALCDGRRTARQIEELMLREHSDLLPSAAEISRLVAQVLSAETD